jgi:hypothetical protein
VAYVGNPFKHDIFVSYSHGDPDDTGHSKLKQWSQGFARELERELRVLPNCGRDVRVFLDQHARPGQGIDRAAPLSDQLRDDIGHSAVLVALMSPHYLQSAWCRDEREWWSTTQRELNLPTDRRIVVIRIWPTTEKWPEHFTDRRGEQLVGYCFYDKERAATRPQPFDWPEPDPNGRGAFRNELLELVGWLNLRLEDVRTQLEDRRRAADEATKLAATGGQVVYLHGRAEYARAWEHAKSQLKSIGLYVMPSEPEQTERDAKRARERRDRRIEMMGDCHALLLVGTDDVRAVDADLLLVGRNDRQQARTRGQLLPCAVLDSAGDPVATPLRPTARMFNVEWIDATRDPWTPAVQQWLLAASRAEAVR